MLIYSQVKGDICLSRRRYQYRWLHNKNFIKQLQKDNIDLSLLQSELGSADNRAKRPSWKQRLLQVIRSNAAQIILCALVLIDAVLVIAEIILEIKALNSEKQDLESAFARTAAFVNSSFSKSLAQSGLLLPEFSPKLLSAPQFAEKLASGMNAIVTALSAPGNVSNCSLSTLVTTDRPSPGRRASMEAASNASRSLSSSFHYDYSHARVLHSVSAVLHCVSIAILALFVTEVALKIVCLGRGFLRDKFEVVDAVVIAVSFVADIVFVKLESSEVSVIVLFLLWRIVRVINGLMMHEKQRDEFRIQLQKRARRVSEMKCDSLENDRDLQEKHAIMLEELCRELGASEDQIANCKPKFVCISKQQSNNALKSMAAMSAGIFGGIAASHHRRTLNAAFSTGATQNSAATSSSASSSRLDPIAEDQAVAIVTNGSSDCRRPQLMRQQRNELEDPWELQSPSQARTELAAALMEHQSTNADDEICITEYLAAA